MSRQAAIKQEVTRILHEEMKRFEANQTQAIKKLVQFQTGNLEHNRFFKSDSDSITFKTPDYNRFLDMKQSGKPQRKIYNRFVWGTYQSLAYRLANVYIEDILKDMRQNTPRQIDIGVL